MTGPNFAFIDVLAAFALWTSLGSVDIFQLPDRFANAIGLSWSRCV